MYEADSQTRREFHFCLSKQIGSIVFNLNNEINERISIFNNNVESLCSAFHCWVRELPLQIREKQLKVNFII